MVPSKPAEPTRERLLVNLACRDIEHGLDSVIHVGWVRIPRSTVEIDEQQQARPRRALVAIGQRMIPRKAAREYGRLVVQVRVEILVSKTGLWRVQSESASSARLALISVVVSTTVTCSANQKNSARARYRVTPLDDR